MGRISSFASVCLLGVSCFSTCSSFGLHHTVSRGTFKAPITIRTSLGSVTTDNQLAALYESSAESQVIEVSSLEKHGAKIATVAATLASCVFLFTQPAAAAELLTAINDKAPDSGFLQAFLLILVSELGDKTFFIAGLLAAKYGRFISFTGSLGALSVMTIISTVLGQLFHAVPSSLTQGIPFDDYIAIAAFTYFGIKTLYDASQLEGDDNAGILEEQAEAEKTVEELTADQKRKSSIALILQTFSLVFAAEIGDRSFLSTIALSAALNPFAVAAGAIGGHGVATGIAVAGGALLSKYLSEKVIGYIGGSLFIVFAITTALGVF